MLLEAGIDKNLAKRARKVATVVLLKHAAATRCPRLPAGTLLSSAGSMLP